MVLGIWESKWARWLLKPLGFSYGRAMALRRRLYDRGFLHSHRFAQPVISVGNLTVGGTGKTPVVSALLDLLPANLRPALVLARGYGGTFEWEGATLNDEGHLLRLRHPDHFLAQGADRIAAAQELLKHENPALIVMDDGAQHLRIQRDLEILLFDAKALARGVDILPAGPWRESLGGARTADACVLTRSDRVSTEALSELHESLRKWAPEAQVFCCQHRPRDLVSLIPGDDRDSDPLTLLAGERVGLLSAIADPGSFESLVGGLGAEVVWHETLGDHRHFGIADLEKILDRARREGLSQIVVTEKDLLKLARVLNKDQAAWFKVLRIDADFGDDRERFAEFLAAKVGKVRLG